MKTDDTDLMQLMKEEIDNQALSVDQLKLLKTSRLIHRFIFLSIDLLSAQETSEEALKVLTDKFDGGYAKFLAALTIEADQVKDVAAELDRRLPIPDEFSFS